MNKPGVYDGDVSKLNKESATAVFQQAVAEFQRPPFGYDLNTAWRMAKSSNPEVFEKMLASAPVGSTTETASGVTDSRSFSPGPLSTFDHAATYRNGPALPLRNPFKITLPNSDTLASLGLPVDATFEEFAAAAKANRDSEPRDSMSIWSALLLLQGAPSPEEAESRARTRYPELATDVDALRRQSASKPATLSNGQTAAGNGASESAAQASQKAHDASIDAHDKKGHAAAAAAHLRAADAQKRAGNEDMAGFHQNAAAFHAAFAK